MCIVDVFSRCKVPRLAVMVGEDNQHVADFKMVDDKKLNKRRKILEANAGFKPLRKRKCDGISSLDECEKMDTVDQKASNAKNLIEETTPIDPAPDEDKIDVKVFPTFNNPKSRKPKPTKKTIKNLKDLQGQQKIFEFFSFTKPNDSPTTDAPT